MPKQSGIHQIRGKYGTTCYYFTKGKQNGLQRGINQQMSERVKRDPEFANTRLYASEFGYCGRLAALSFVPTEFGLTINLRNNSQGRLTRNYRNLLDEYGYGEFGHRRFFGLRWQPLFVAQINEMCRINTDLLYPIEYSVALAPTGQTNQYDVLWTIRWNSTLVDRMTENGLNHLWLRLRHFVLNTGHFNAQSGAYVDIAREVGGYSSDYQLPIEYARTHTEYSIKLSNARIVHPRDVYSEATDGNSWLSRPIVAIEGYRKVGDKSYKQQSLCGFKVLDNSRNIDTSISKINYMGVDYFPNSSGPYVDGEEIAPILVYSEYIKLFTSAVGFSARVNFTDLSVTAIEDDYAILSVSSSFTRQKARKISLTFPNGQTQDIEFDTANP